MVKIAKSTSGLSNNKTHDERCGGWKNRKVKNGEQSKSVV